MPRDTAPAPAQIEELFARIRAADLAQVDALVAAEPALAKCRNAAGIAAILFALYHRQQEIAAALARAAEPIDDLFVAVALGRAELVDELTTRDSAPVRSFSPDGFTPLHYAGFFAHPTVAALLLGRGADVRAVARNPMRVEPLHSAAASNQIEVVALLLAAGAAVDAEQEGGFTALHAAAQHGNAVMTRLLLAWGADPRRPSQDGKTAADHARSLGHHGVAELLDLRPAHS
jgi:ankyrin repeat protein